MHPVFRNKRGTQIIDMNAAPAEEKAVIRLCVICNGKTAVAESDLGPTLCSDACRQEAARAQTNLSNLFQKWADKNAAFYRCAFNAQKVVDLIKSRNLEWTEDSLDEAFAELRGELLEHITPKQIKALNAAEYEQRLRIDPEMGGHLKAINTGEILTSDNQRRPIESATPETTLRPNLQALQEAGRRAAQEVASSRTNRYNGPTLYRNGFPTSSDNLVDPNLRTFRNGRKVG